MVCILRSVSRYRVGVPRVSPPTNPPVCLSGFQGEDEGILAVARPGKCALGTPTNPIPRAIVPRARALLFVTSLVRPRARARALYAAHLRACLAYSFVALYRVRRVSRYSLLLCLRRWPLIDVERLSSSYENSTQRGRRHCSGTRHCARPRAVSRHTRPSNSNRRATARPIIT